MPICHSERDAELAYCERRIAEIRAKYTRPDEQLYLTLLIRAWEHHMAIVKRQQNDVR